MKDEIPVETLPGGSNFADTALKGRVDPCFYPLVDAEGQL